MEPNYTYREIAESWDLWKEAVDPGANMTEADFDDMSIEERVLHMVACFGAPEEAYVTNPWTKDEGLWEPTEPVTQDQLDAWAMLMDDNIRERLNEILPDGTTPTEYVRAWAAVVGEVEAGRVLIGS